MGFSDSFRKIRKQFKAGSDSGISKLGVDDDKGSGKWFNAATLGSFKSKNMYEVTDFASNPSFSKFDTTLRGQIQSHNQAARNANAGHLLLNPDDGKGETPPAPGDSPGVGSETTEAVRAARRNALAAAAARRRGSQTVTTTPLGVTQSASTSKKTLLGQ